MSDWMEAAAQAEAVADNKQAAEELAEKRFDAVHSRAQAAGEPGSAVNTEEFRQWMAARGETDAAWGAWSTVMDAKPAA
ncbi:MAG: hypothetical protein HYX47_18690 [Burkholderiales bacterium]|nr:hypothetical protein [Burkholderiales bacterium]